MKLSKAHKRTINRWLSAVETGDPDGNYGAISVYADNPRNNLQITYGKHQTTEVGGKLVDLIRAYLAQAYERGSTLTSRTLSHLIQFTKAKRYSQVGNRPLRMALRKAGSDPLMQEVQDEFFLENYMKPALSWADKNGFTKPLSMLVIYDSFVHSGGIPNWLRRRFAAVPPAKGGDEQEWIKQYMETRHQWLKTWGNGRTSKSKLLRTSSYRTEALLNEIQRRNWTLSPRRPMEVNGITI